MLEKIPQIKKLNQQEKLALVGELWDEIIEKDYPNISEEEKQILDQRYRNFKKDPQKGLSWDEVQEEIKGQ